MRADSTDRNNARSAALCSAFFALLLVVAACAPVVAPLGIESDVPALEDRDFLARDGMKLPLREWDASHPRAILIAVHAMGDYSGDFDMPAKWWAAHGITTIAYDQRGFGRAPNPGLWAGTQTLVSDFDDFADAVRRKHPGVPVFALGESMGAAVVATALAGTYRPNVDGAILAAPAVWSRKEMPGYYSIVLWLGAHAIPWYRFSGGDLNAQPTDNFAMLRASSKDPLNQHTTRADAIWGLVNLMEDARDGANHLPAAPPILIVYGAKDAVVPRASTDAFLATIGSRAEKKEYPDGYHMILRDLDAELVLADITAWMDRVDGACRGQGCTR